MAGVYMLFLLLAQVPFTEQQSIFELEVYPIVERLVSNLPEYLSWLTEGDVELAYWGNKEATTLEEELAALDLNANDACNNCRVSDISTTHGSFIALIS
jgi:hypothetical protein